MRNPMVPVADERMAWRDRPVSDLEGGRLGNIAAVLIDPETDVVWLLIALSGDSGYTLVPARGASSIGGGVFVEPSRAKLRGGPRSPHFDAFAEGPFRSEAYRNYLPGIRRRRSPAAPMGYPAPAPPHATEPALALTPPSGVGSP